MQRKSNKKFSLKSGPLKSSGFKQMGSPMRQDEHQYPTDFNWERPSDYYQDLYRIQKTPQDFANWDKEDGKLSKKEMKAYQEYVQNQIKKYNDPKATKSMRNRAQLGDNTNILSPQQQKINKQRRIDNKPPRFVVHEGPDGFLYQATLNPDGTIKSLKQPGGGRRGMTNEQYYYKKYGPKHGADWRKAWQQDVANRELNAKNEAMWRDDIRTKYNLEGAPRFYMSDSANDWYKSQQAKGNYAYNYGRDYGMNEEDDNYHPGMSKLYMRGPDDLRKLEIFARNPALTDRQRATVRSMIDNYQHNNGIMLSFKDSDIESNYMQWDNPATEEIENIRRPAELGLDRGNWHRGGNPGSGGSTDPELTRMLINLTQTGNRNQNVTNPLQNIAKEDATEKVIINDLKVDKNNGGNDGEKNGDNNRGEDPSDSTLTNLSPTGNEEKLVPSNKKVEKGTFNQAFNNARNQGQAEFTWNGKKFHTRRADETPRAWADLMKVNQANHPGALMGDQPGPAGQTNFEDYAYLTNKIKDGSATPEEEDRYLETYAINYLTENQGVNAPGFKPMNMYKNQGELAFQQPGFQEDVDKGTGVDPVLATGGDPDKIEKVVSKETITPGNTEVDDDPIVFNEADMKGVDDDDDFVEEDADTDEELNILPSKEDTEAYGSSGQPQSVEREEYEPQSVETNNEPVDDSSSDDDDDDDE